MADEAVMPTIEIPELRVRRFHQKSRFGCVTCKRRRVKCDESRPICNRCQVKDLECVYSEESSHSPREFKVTASRKSSKDSSSNSPRDSSHGSSPWDAGLQNPASVPDAVLAQHYLTHTIESLSRSSVMDSQSEVWRVFIPAMALTCPIVRRGMLTLAAICLHYDSDAGSAASGELNESPSEYLMTAEAHGTIFVRESRQKLSNLQHQAEFDSSFACSRLLCILGFAFFRAHRSNGVTLADDAAWTWLQLLRGMRSTYAIISQSGKAVNETAVRDWNLEIPSASPSIHWLPSNITPGYENPFFPFVQQSRWDRFDALRMTLHGSSIPRGDERIQDLSSAIELLWQLTDYICSQEVQSLFHTICTWPGSVPKGFVDMLMNGDPLAIAVHAHWLMLIILVENHWWVGDMGSSGIHNAISMCSEADFDVRALLRWPQLIVAAETT